MQSVRFPQFSDDATLQSVGSLFRKVDGSKWGVNLGFYPRQEKRSLSVSCFPVLARRRVFNPTQAHKPAGYRQGFQIGNTSAWATQVIRDCPALKSQKLHHQELKQNCFVFNAASELEIWMPQFELARALFFHDAYLSRTAIESDCLESEFDIAVDRTLNFARINVLPSSGYSKRLFDNYGARRVLSWILIDPDARASFESIGKYQKLHGEEYNGYRHWNFQFDPPSLKAVQLFVRGKYDPQTNCMFVFEIDSMRNIHSSVSEEVEFYHPEFCHNVRGDKGGGWGWSSERSPEHSVYDGEDANADHGQALLRVPMVEFEFATPFKTSKHVENTREGKTGSKDEEAAGSSEEGSSVDEPIETGALPGADWDAVDDQTDDAHLYSNKFECFHQAINKLIESHGCTLVSKQIRKLPSMPRCKRHLLADGNPRCISVVEIEISGVNFHVLEVDTSDSVTPLSTQVLCLKDSEAWPENLVKLEKELVRNSMHWPQGSLSKLSGIGRHAGVSHPKSSSTYKGVLEAGSIDDWAAKFHKCIQSMLM